MNEHSLATILRAIADGKQVQVLVMWDETNDVWIDIPTRSSISLYAEKTYRVKPEETQ